MPKSDHTTPPVVSGGRGMSAIVYDTDLSFSVQRLRHFLLTRISHLLPLSDETEKEEIAQQSLVRLHVFRPTSPLQLATSLKNLPLYHASHMPNDEIGVIAIDSMSTFYWGERFSAEQMRNVAPEKARNMSEPAFIPPLYHVLNAIQSVRLSHGPVVVLTNWALGQANTASRFGMPYKQHLHPFPTLDVVDLGAKAAKNTDHISLASPFHLMHNISLSSPPPAPFLPDTPLDNALRQEAQYRKEAVEKGQVFCLVRSSRTRDTSRFTFYITNEDIVIQQSGSHSNRIQP
ncbi:hypothetical protein PAXRUDRAFT_823212 [Paxillus rubicundulus Ve08.2h10]|uniref:DNA recombination and repair protein Rad51-like C-terminal domain-containing protein n=1 Tax=Paxillus rubicundulus Ve08.2h10 TaxID=930991 RepID=A0A0D0E426_9AGAM|nr:hypothetical protein PAXRUDRAFT_823212 [Paxillus rubicundulus Ve08.2h10]